MIDYLPILRKRTARAALIEDAATSLAFVAFLVATFALLSLAAA